MTNRTRITINITPRLLEIIKQSAEKRGVKSLSSAAAWLIEMGSRE